MDAVTRSGHTALHLAAGTKQEDLAALLLAYGADVNRPIAGGRGSRPLPLEGNGPEREGRAAMPAAPAIRLMPEAAASSRFDVGGNLGYGCGMTDDERRMLREIIEHCRAEAERRARTRSAEDPARTRAYGRVMRAARELLEEDA